MKLLPEEIFALKKVFGKSEYYSLILQNLINTTVIKREHTGVGFFTTIIFPSPIFNLDKESMWDWNFSHKQLPYGGSFIFYKESPNELTLEAVTFDGLWPQKFNETYFSDLKHYCPAQKSNNESDT